MLISFGTSWIDPECVESMYWDAGALMVCMISGKEYRFWENGDPSPHVVEQEIKKYHDQLKRVASD